MIPLPSKEMIQAAAEVMNDHGFDVKLPWHCDLDDVEMARYCALQDAIAAAMRVQAQQRSGPLAPQSIHEREGK